MVSDPQKYEYTLATIRRDIETKKQILRQQKTLMQRDIDIHSHKKALEKVSTGQVIGSKYRFQKSNVTVADLECEKKQQLLQEKEQMVFDLELYLDIKPKGRKSKADEDKRAVEQLADDD